MEHNLAMVFPGQGSQSVAMLADLAPNFNEVSETFDEASSTLGYDLWALVHDGPKERLNLTQYTQPALLTASIAIWRILQMRNFPQPNFVAGHSLGEYTALVCAKALDFKDALKLVTNRAEYMQSAVPEGEGGMAAIIGLDDEIVEQICTEVRTADEVLSPANYNSVGQVVIAGHLLAIRRAIDIAKVKGAKLAMMIPVSVPSHCELMSPAAEKLAHDLQAVAFDKPEITVINNVSAIPYEDVDQIREGLKRQLYSPVQWVKTIQWMVQNGVHRVIECGPGKVLTGLNKRINHELIGKTTATFAEVKELLTQNIAD